MNKIKVTILVALIGLLIAVLTQFKDKLLTEANTVPDAGVTVVTAPADVDAGLDGGDLFLTECEE